MTVKQAADDYIAFLRTEERAKKTVVIHSLRYFFETFTVNTGTPQRAVDAWFGHRSDKSMGAVLPAGGRGLPVVHGESPVRDGRAGGRRRPGGCAMRLGVGRVLLVVPVGTGKRPCAKPGQAGTNPRPPRSKA